MKDEPEPGPGTAHLRWVLRKRAEGYPGGQKALSIDVGVSQPTVSNWLRGTRGGRISPDQVVALARVFNITTDELLGVTPLPTIDPRALRAGLERMRRELDGVAEQARRGAEEEAQEEHPRHR